MNAFVAQLIEAREILNLSQSDVADQLRVSINTIRSIEGDEYTPESMTVFVRGYIRSYAKLVGLTDHDVDDFFASLSVLDRPDKPAPAQFEYKSVTSRDKPIKFITIGIIVLIVILVGSWAAWQHGESTAKTGILPAAAPAKNISAQAAAKAVVTTSAAPVKKQAAAKNQAKK